MTFGQDVLARADGEHIEHISLQGLGFYEGAVAQHGEGHRLQGVVASEQHRRLVSLQCESCSSEAVYLHGRIKGAGLQSVLHHGHAAAQSDDVGLPRLVVVVVIVLAHLQLDGVLTLHAVHRMAETIVDRHRVFRVKPGQGHLGRVSGQVGGHVVLVAEVTERVVAQLPVGHLHRTMVDAVVDGVATDLGVYHRDGVNIFIGTHIGGVLLRETVGQIDHLAHLSLLEQRGIATTVDLLHLPAHRWQQHLVLAGSLVGPDGHAFALRLHRGVMLVAVVLVTHHLSALGAVRVLVVVDQPRRVVALQREHNGERIAQIVLREVVHQRQLALVVATHDASGEFHLRGIVEIGVGHVGGEVVTGGTLIVAVVGELVAVHHHLDGVDAWQHLERETTVVVRLQHFALRVVDRLAVHLEVGTLHGDARAVVHHEAREVLTVLYDDFAHRLVVAMGIEGDAGALRREFYARTITDGTHFIIDFRIAVVRQFVGHVVSVVVGIDACHLLAVMKHVHLDTGGTRAVVEAHIALQSAGVLTLAHLRLSLGTVAALAVVDGHHLIFVGSQGRHAGVLVTHLVQVGGDDLPVVVALTLYAAHHVEEVDGVAVGVPRQQHTALAGLRQQFLLYLTAILVVELLEVVGRMCHNGGCDIVPCRGLGH